MVELVASTTMARLDIIIAIQKASFSASDQSLRTTEIYLYQVNIYFHFNPNRVLLEHQWYEKSPLLMMNNRTFLKSWEQMNMTEVSLVCLEDLFIILNQ